MLTPPPEVSQQVAAALLEDVGPGDVTAHLVPESQTVSGTVITREAAVLCGSAWVEETFRQLDPSIRLSWQAQDGEDISGNQTLLQIAGRARAVLTGERTALNFLQLLSGTATAARRFSRAIEGTGCAILDTRKTIPGLRTAQKYAVRCGGGQNHRMGLFDQVLIKENHIVAAGSIGAAVQAARPAAIESARRGSARLRIEVEVESLAELEEALAAGPDIVMLDEFTLKDMKAAVQMTRVRAPNVKLEASGGVSLETVRAIAETGVNYISVGSITKQVRAVDLSLRLQFRT